jgi:hypothetical protein
VLMRPKKDGWTSRWSWIYLVANVKNNIIEWNAISGTNYHTGISNREDNSCTGNLVKGNKITWTNTERTIWFQSNETQIEGNSIEWGSYAWIRLLDASYCSIIWNKLKWNTRDADNAYPEIWIQWSCSKTLILDNIIISWDNRASNWINLDWVWVSNSLVFSNIFENMAWSNVVSTLNTNKIQWALATLDEVDTAQIVNHAVTNTKLAQMNANTVKGRLSWNGTPQDIPMSDLPIPTSVQTALDWKQATLVSWTNIKTINGNSLLWSGDLVISGGWWGNIILQDYQWQAVTGLLWRFDATTTGTLTEITLIADSLPVGSNVIAELRKNSTTSGNVLSSILQVTTAQWLTNGRYVGTPVTSFTSSAIADWDVFYLYLTSIGSTTPAQNVRAILRYS